MEPFHVAQRTQAIALLGGRRFTRFIVRYLLSVYGPTGLNELYGRFIEGDGAFDGMTPRMIWRARAKRRGDAVELRPGARFRRPHPSLCIKMPIVALAHGL